jgi:RsmE family RNA methyltransferase
VNLILFEADEIAHPLPRSDPRAEHLLHVLGRRAGDTFDAGLINGPRGKGTLGAIDTAALTLSFAWGPDPPPLPPIVLIIGLPRPQTARDILRDATSLGVAAMHFVTVDKGEPSYGRSTLWTNAEWRRHLILGAAQAFDTRLPEVTHGRSLLEVMGRLSDRAVRVALDHYEAETAFTRCRLTEDTATFTPSELVLAFGPERGWSNAERAALRGAGFTLAHLGSRVLRTETAVAATLALGRARLGLI